MAATAAAGASFAARLYQDALFAAEINSGTAGSYTPLGSARGNCRILGFEAACAAGDVLRPTGVAWTGTEIPFAQVELDAFPDLRTYPTAAGAVVPVYNLPVDIASSSALELTMDALTRVLTGQISSWHDPELVQLNPWLQELPAKRIRVVVSEDGSGTTRILRQALAAQVPAFGALVDVSRILDWGPNATSHTRAHGNFGMAAQLLQSSYSIGYLSLAEVRAFSALRAASIRKSSGTAVVASFNTVNLAMSERGLDWGLDLGLASWKPDVADVSSLGQSAWPITSLTYMAMRTNTTSFEGNETCASRRWVFDFWEWFYTSSTVSGLAADHGFVPLPTDVAHAVLARLAKDLRCKGELVVGAWVPVQQIPFAVDSTLSDVISRLDILYKTPPFSEQALAKFLTLSFSIAQSTRDIVGGVLHSASSGTQVQQVSAGIVYADALVTLPTEDRAGLATLPISGVGISLIYSLCGTQFDAECLFEGRSVRLDVDLVVALCEGEVTTWGDERLVALNGWMGEEPAASILNSSQMVIFADGLESESMNVLNQLLQRLRPGANISMGAFLPGGVGRLREGPAYVKAAVAATPLSIGIAPLLGSIHPPLAIAAIGGTGNQGLFIAPSTTSLGRCATDTDVGGIYFQLSASQHPECYPLSTLVYLVTRKDFTMEECYPQFPNVPSPPAALVSFLKFGLTGDPPPAKLPIESLNMYPLFADDQERSDRLLRAFTCGGVSILDTASTEDSDTTRYFPILFSLIGAVVCLVLALFMGWRVYSTRFNDLRNDIQEGDSKKELLALFANPWLPGHAQAYSRRPLSFGQDMKHLLRAMDMRDVAIEPAATAVDAQVAMLKHRPKIVVFSGHTIMGTLAFEDTEGKMDKHARPETFAQILRGQLPSATPMIPSSSPKGASPCRRHMADIRANHNFILRSFQSLPSTPKGSRGSNGTSKASESQDEQSQSFHSSDPTSKRSNFDSTSFDKPISNSFKVRRPNATSNRATSASFKLSRPTSHSTKLDFPNGHGSTRSASSSNLQSILSRQYGMTLDSLGTESPSSIRTSSPLRHTLPRSPGRLAERLKNGGPTDASCSQSLTRELLQGLECVVLNGCKTEDIGRELLELGDHVSVVCWATLAEDNAARAFAKGFYESVRRQRQAMLTQQVKNWKWRRHAQKKFRIDEAFKAGCESFNRDGFSFGNPEDYLHPPGHPHHRKPDFTGCLGCMPPVHGQCLFLHTVNGEVKATSGSSLFPYEVPRTPQNNLPSVKAPTLAMIFVSRAQKGHVSLRRIVSGGPSSSPFPLDLTEKSAD